MQIPDIVRNISTKTVLVLAGIYMTGFVAYKIRQRLKLNRYHAKCLVARQKRDDKIRALQTKLSGLNLDPEQVKMITQLPLRRLVDMMKSGELLVLDVLHAYQAAALAAHGRTNCLTNICEDVEIVARQMDSDRQRGATPTGLLYGVPISVKDNIPTKGHVISRGCAIYSDVIAAEDALLVEALKAEGAIPFVKTNIPQLMLGIETGNALYGTTSNPHDLSRTPGGSSGGEGALLVDNGSILGLGSDTGGSIRIPSAFCGICGIKPTSNRLSLKGVVPFGQTIVRPCWGPMARDVDSLAVAMDAALRDIMFSGDKTIPPMPFDYSVYNSSAPMTIGYYTDDGLVPVVPAMARAVMETKKILEDRGHKLVPWKPPEIEFAYEGIFRSLSGDRGCMYRSVLRTDEIIDASIIGTINAFMLSYLMRRWKIFKAGRDGIKWLQLRYKGCRGVSSVMQLFTWTTAAKLFFQRFEKSWRDAGLDAVICPSFGTAAIRKDFTLKAPVYLGYGSIYNFLDYVGGVCPVTTVSQQDIADLEAYSGLGRMSHMVVEDQRGTLGLPVSVQCVAPTWREETCLRVMAEVERGLKRAL